MPTNRVAALYVDASGPYASMEGVDAWPKHRNATNYRGPFPVVAHPPCGHWGRYHQKCHDDGATGPVAVHQVRSFGGVLEHPKASKLWRECNLPLPGHGADSFGGWTLEVRQIDWGHRATKATWLYIVGTDKVPPMPPERQDPPPPPPYRSGRQPRGVLETLSKRQRMLTPVAFAEWLVTLASTCRR